MVGAFAVLTGARGLFDPALETDAFEIPPGLEPVPEGEVDAGATDVSDAVLDVSVEVDKVAVFEEDGVVVGGITVS